MSILAFVCEWLIGMILGTILFLLLPLDHAELPWLWCLVATVTAFSFVITKDDLIRQITEKQR